MAARKSRAKKTTGQAPATTDNAGAVELVVRDGAGVAQHAARFAIDDHAKVADALRGLQAKHETTGDAATVKDPGADVGTTAPTSTAPAPTAD